MEKFLKPFEIVPFSDEMTAEYADTRSELERIGKPIGGNDYLMLLLQEVTMEYLLHIM